MTCDSCGSDDITTFRGVRVIKRSKFLFGLRTKEECIPIRLLYHCNACGCLKFLIEVYGNYTRRYQDTSTYAGTHVTISSAWDLAHRDRGGGDGYARYIDNIEGYFYSKLSTPLRYKPNGPIIYTCSKYRKLNCLNCDLGDEESKFHTGYYCPVYHRKHDDKSTIYVIKIDNTEVVLGNGV